MLIVLFCFIFLVACVSTIPSPTTSVIVASTPTIISSPTLLHFPTSTPQSTAIPKVATPFIPTAIPTSTYIITASHPISQEVALFLAHLHKWSGQPNGYPYNDFVRQDVDVNGDQRSEILITGDTDNAMVYFAILGRVANNWQEMYYSETYGHYCAKVRVTPANDHIAADFLTCGGGTGLLEVKWRQDWVRCQSTACTLVWSAPMWDTFRAVGPTTARQQQVAKIDRPDPNTILLTTRRFAVKNLLPSQRYAQGYEPSASNWANIARRVVGPDTLVTYHWNGKTYQQFDSKQLAAGEIIFHDFDLLTQDTIIHVNNLLAQPFERSDGTMDTSGMQNALTAFWGKAVEVTWGDWSQHYAYVAIDNGKSEQLGNLIAFVADADKRPICRLTLQHHSIDTFDLVDRVEMPCTSNFTQLAWADVTRDGVDDLLLITLPPDDESEETGAGLQRLYIYDVSNGLKQIAMIDGAINGEDGIGIQWRKASDGRIEVMAGLPLMPLTLAPTWPDLERHFQIYHWDIKSQSLVSDQIETFPEQ